jgi:hypothetical protein
MTSSVVVAGVGMVPFAKPGASATYDEMGATASRMALADAGIGYESVQQAYAGYVYEIQRPAKRQFIPSASPGFRSSTSITIVLAALPPCFSAGRLSPPAQRTAS